MKEGRDVALMNNQANLLCIGEKEVKANEKETVELLEMSIREEGDFNAMNNQSSVLCRETEVEANEKRVGELNKMAIRGVKHIDQVNN